MAYDFHYTPTGTGVISGKEVLEQTEDAINDLGNTAISGVQEALDKAEQALTNSENAVDDAQTALNTANNAEGVAIQAQTDVGNLSGTVTNIGNRVTTAEGNISNLQGRMTTAEGNITNLQGRMTTAESNIGNLQTAVSTAQATANSAQQTATTARQQSYVFRYSGTAVVPNSTIAYSTIDNTDNIKAGDKILDVDGKLFEITAVDTTNQTVTVGTALIDLALDANVVHTSGNETISGAKYFNGIIYSIGGIQTRLSTQVTSGESSSKSWAFIDNAYKSLFKLVVSTNTDKSTRVEHVIYNVDSNNTETLNRITWRFDNNSSVSELRPTDNAIKLGTSLYRWSEVYATNYYYGSNNVEFSTKFVTTDTNQSVLGQKVFNDINAISSSAEIGVSGGNNSFKILDKNKKTLLRLEGGTFSGGMAYSYLLVNNGSDVFNGVSLYQSSANLAQLRPYSSTLSLQLGASNRYFSDCYTSKINGLTPSSLSLPNVNINSFVDISGYFTNTGTGETNTYPVTANGWIYLRLSNISGCQAEIYDSSNNRLYATSTSGSIEQVMIPVVSGVTFKTQWATGSAVTVNIARFIPCQGNI